MLVSQRSSFTDMQTDSIYSIYSITVACLLKCNGKIAPVTLVWALESVPPAADIEASLEAACGTCEVWGWCFGLFPCRLDVLLWSEMLRC